MISRPNVALGNLRAVVILIVVAFHSALAYLASQPADAFAFDAPPYRWIAFPILDERRWFGFDLFCAWQDIRLTSCQAQTRSKTNDRLSSSMAQTIQRYGSTVKRKPTMQRPERQTTLRGEAKATRYW